MCHHCRAVERGAKRVSDQRSDFLTDALASARQRPALALITLGATITLSVVHFFIQRPVYEVSASISLGNIGLIAEKSRLIPPAEQVIARLQERYGAKYHRMNASDPYLLSVDLSRKESSVIYFVARGNSAKEVAAFLNTVITEEIGDAETTIDNELKAREQIITSRRESLTTLKHRLAFLYDDEKENDPQVSYILTVETANIQQQVNSLEYQINVLEAETRSWIADAPRVLLRPPHDTEVSALQPALVSYLTLGVIVGGTLAFLLPWLLAQFAIGIYS